MTVGWSDPGRGMFSISVAADLAGLHPQTLRIYEREGLVDPARSAGRTRRYSPNDIDRLREITALTAAGLNLAGVRRVLELQQETRRLQAEIDRLRLVVETQQPAPAAAQRGKPAAWHDGGTAARARQQGPAAAPGH